MTTTFAALAAEVLAFRDAREWAQFHTPKEIATSLCIESGELAELFQWKRDDEVRAKLEDPAFRERVAHELADVQILLLLAAHASGVDLPTAVRAKLALNEQRYPVEQARGNAKKYDEL